MTKQEFMAMSLPYKLKCQVSFRKEILELDLIKTDSTFGFKGSRYFKDCKPILRQLSDLTKPIEHGGEKFVPEIKLKELFGGRIRFDVYTFYNQVKESVVRDAGAYPVYFPCINGWLKLIEWHFDIAELIEKGEAIDVNTLEINPYK